MNEEMLSSYLTSGDDRLLMSAIRYLDRNGTLDHLKSVLDTTKLTLDPYLVKLAVQAAGNIIRRNLLAHFGELDATTRVGLARLLANLDPQVVSSIGVDLSAKDEAIRLNAVRILGLMGANPAIATLLKDLLRDKDDRVRATAVSVIRSMPDAVDTPVLAALLRDGDARVVANTIELIDAMAQPRLVPLLLRFEDHESNRIRANALKALWRMNEPSARASVRRMLEDGENPLMRASGCWVVGECASRADEDVLALLQVCAGDPDPRVRDNAEKARIKITGGAGGITPPA